MGKHFGGNNNYGGNATPQRSYGGTSLSTGELAKAFFYAKDASTEEELKEKLEKYFLEKERRVVKVYIFGDGDGDFVAEKEYAEMVADTNFKVRAALAWEDEKGELTLMTKEEMKEYFKKRPRR